MLTFTENSIGIAAVGLLYGLILLWIRARRKVQILQSELRYMREIIKQREIQAESYRFARDELSSKLEKLKNYKW